MPEKDDIQDAMPEHMPDVDPDDVPETFDINDAQRPEFLDASEQDPSDSAAGEGEAQAADTLHNDILDLEEKLRRAHADYVNYRRVAERNVQMTKEQTTMSLARALVAPLDSFDFTLQQDADAISKEDLFKGVETLRNQLVQALSNFGLKKLTVEAGDEFDPNLHTALMRQPHDDIESGKIVMMLQPGYAVNDKVVRPVNVAVAQ